MCPAHALVSAGVGGSQVSAWSNWGISGFGNAKRATRASAQRLSCSKAAEAKGRLEPGHAPHHTAELSWAGGTPAVRSGASPGVPNICTEAEGDVQPEVHLSFSVGNVYPS